VEFTQVAIVVRDFIMFENSVMLTVVDYGAIVMQASLAYNSPFGLRPFPGICVCGMLRASGYPFSDAG